MPCEPAILKFVASTELLKVAAPASDISRVRAVMVEPPSSPWKIMSLSWILELIIKLAGVLSVDNIPKDVPPSFKNICWPSASRIISPPESIVKLAASEIVEPLIVISSTVRVVRVPRLVILGWAAVASVPVIAPKAVIAPVILISPVPVISLEFKSKSPPNCGVVSSTTLLIETASALALVKYKAEESSVMSAVSNAIFADPSKLTPAIVLAVAKTVAEPALPVALAATTDKLSTNALLT